MKRVFTFILAIIFFSALSCSKSDKDKQEPNISNMKSGAKHELGTLNGNKPNKGVQNIGTENDFQNYNNTMIDIDISGQPLPSELLLDFFPDRIPGMEKSKPSSGTIYGENADVTTASFTYSSKNSGIAMTVSDFGKFSNIPAYDTKYFITAPKDPVLENFTIVDKIGKGYIFWDTKKRSGSLYYLLANRFIIKIEGYSLPPEISDLTFFLEKFKRKEIINKAKNN